MAAGPSAPSGPDLTQGIAATDVPDNGMLAGHFGDEAVLIARRGSEYFAIGATCTHYSGPLAEGLLVGDTVRCPWHHACFSLRTGEALRAPAFDAIPRWRVEQQGDRVRLCEKLPAAAPIIMPHRIWNWATVPAWLAATRPRPSSEPPASTTARVPNRSDSAPHRNEAGPMHRKLSRAAVEMLVRDQPVAIDIGCRNIPSDIIVPMPRHVMTMPAPTTIQP